MKNLGRVAAVAAALVLAGGVTACGSNDDDSGGDGGGDKKKIALLLPESQTTRYESFDRPLFEAKVAEECDDCEVVYFNADQDENKQADQVDSAISQEVDVIVLDPVNGEA